MQLNIRLYPGQARALRALLDPIRRDVLVAAGTGGGKTHWNAAAATMLALRNPPRVNGMMVAPTYQMMEDVMRPEFEEFWDAHRLPYQWIASAKTYSLPFTRNAILMRSGEHPNRLRGKNIGWAGLEEASYHRHGPTVLKECYKRIRHPDAAMRRIFASTTPNGFDYAYEWAANPTRKNADLTTCIQWHTRENLAVIEADASWLAHLASVLSDDEYQQEVEASFLVIGKGRAYYAFNRAENERMARAYSGLLGVVPSMPLDLCVDFNVDPCGWVISQGDGAAAGDPIRAIDEITVRGDKSTWLALSTFQERYPQYASGRGVRIFGDATGDNRKTTGPSDFAMIESVLPHAEFFVRHRNPAEKDRRNAVNVALCDGSERRHAFVHPERCPELITDLEQAQMRDGKIDKLRDKKRSHWSDAWGYKIHYIRPVYEHTAAEVVRRRRQQITPEDVYQRWLDSH